MDKLNSQIYSENLNKTSSFILRIRKSFLLENIVELIILFVVMSLAISNFLSLGNMISILKSFSLIGIVVIGECIVFIIGGIDFSVISIFLFAGTICNVAVAKWNQNFITGIFLGLLSGILFGLANGIIISKFDIPSFIVTVGTLCVAKGFSSATMTELTLYNIPNLFLINNYVVFGIFPLSLLLSLIIFLVLGVACAFMLRLTIYGRWIYAIGSNEEASILSGVKTQKVKIYTYGLSGLLASISGIVAIYILHIQTNYSNGYEFDPILAVIVGGASLYGGLGKISGAIVSTAIVVVLRDALGLLKVSNYWQQSVIGLLIILFCILNVLRYKKYY